MSMKNGLFQTAVVLCIAISAPAGFVHPGGLFKQSDLERMRYMAAVGAEPYLTSFNTMKADPRASYAYVVRGDPNATVLRRPNSAFESDVTAAYLNALMWALTNDKRHAEKCVEIFRAWSNLTCAAGGGTESLDAGLYAWKLVEAAEIIKSTYAGWSQADIDRFAAMLVYPGYSNTAVPPSVNSTHGSFYWRIYNGDPGRHGNQDMIAWRAMIAMAVFLDNRIMYDRALNYFKGKPHRRDDLPYPGGPPYNSASPTSTNDYWVEYSLLSRSSAIGDYGYNGVLANYIWENGQCQESSRDQSHTFFGIGIAAGIAEVAWNQGDGVWNALDSRLLKGFEFTARYNASYLQSYDDQSTPWEPTVESGEFLQRLDRTGRWFSRKINPYVGTDYKSISRGNFPGTRPCFEQAVAHFTVRMGDAAPWTVRARDLAIQRSGYEQTGWAQDHPGWGALCFRRPDGCAGDPICGFADGAPVFKIAILPGTIEAENYDYFPPDVDGEGRTHHDTTPANSGGQYRTGQSVDIEPCPEGGYALTDMNDGEWLSYTVFVPVTGFYHIQVRYAASTAGTALRFAFNGSDVTGSVTLPSSDWTSYTVADSVFLTKGVQSMRLDISVGSAACQLDRMTFSVAPQTR